MTVASITMTWIVGRRLKLSPRAKIALHSLLLMGYTQALVGITTLVNNFCGLNNVFYLVVLCPRLACLGASKWLICIGHFGILALQ